MTTELVDELDKTNRPPVEVAIDLAQELLHKPLQPPNTEDKMYNKNASKMEAQAACEKLKRIIEAAENSNQAGENAAVIAAAAVTASHTSPKVEGVRADENFNLRKMQAVVEEAWQEIVAAIVQMIPEDDQIICDRVKRAEGMLCALVTGNKYKEEK